MPTDIDLAAHCQKCHHADCASGTADFQSLCEERALANERINRLALQRRDEVEAESSCDPVDALTCERAISARLVKRIAELERALAARIEKQIDGLAERTALVARVEELERERDHFARRYDEVCGESGRENSRLFIALAASEECVTKLEDRVRQLRSLLREACDIASGSLAALVHADGEFVESVASDQEDLLRIAKEGGVDV